jgi:hypothetical protein
MLTLLVGGTLMRRENNVSEENGIPTDKQVDSNESVLQLKRVENGLKERNDVGWDAFRRTPEL